MIGAIEPLFKNLKNVEMCGVARLYVDSITNISIIIKCFFKYTQIVWFIKELKKTVQFERPLSFIPQNILMFVEDKRHNNDVPVFSMFPQCCYISHVITVVITFARLCYM